MGQFHMESYFLNLGNKKHSSIHRNKMLSIGIHLCIREFRTKTKKIDIIHKK